MSYFSILGDGISDGPRVVAWSLVLVVLLLCSFAGVNAIRKWLKQDEPSVGLGFTLGDLRELHRAGQMTDEEFERARGRLIGQTKLDAQKAAKQRRVGPV